MGGGSWTTREWDEFATKSGTKTATSASHVYTSRDLKEEFDPKMLKKGPNGVGLRESCDLPGEHPESTAIALFFDVTGSMDPVLLNMVKKLNVLIENIYERKPVKDPQVLLGAIGDAMCDQAPLQVTQFESDIRIAKQLTALWLERGGGGNMEESYQLPWLFAARHTVIDCYQKRGKKGYLFTIGDELIPMKTRVHEVERVFGYKPQGDIDTRQLLDEVSRMYEVFHVTIRQGANYQRSNDVVWKDLLGERVLFLDDYTALPEVICSAIEINEGRDHKEVVDSWSGSTAVAVRNATQALTSKLGHKTTETGAVVF